MLEGYTVTEAASVLGVPSERVWELIARGVLAAEPEGKTGMRVFLQPRTPVPAHRGGRSENGDAERSSDADPFRALLTEFRNLTERYGQALLALGEARGEVASLRSRVDLLEARIDLRLPSSAAEPPVAWNPPPAPAPDDRRAAAVAAPDTGAGPADEPEPTEATVAPIEAIPEPVEAAVEPVEAIPEPAEAPDEDARATRRRRRTLSNREAVAWFAEAIARADDPSRPELLRTADVAEALAALGGETTTQGEAAVEEELLVGASASAVEVPIAEELEPEELEPQAERSGADAMPPVEVDSPDEPQPPVEPERQATEAATAPREGLDQSADGQTGTAVTAEGVEPPAPIAPSLAPHVTDEGPTAHDEPGDWLRPDAELEAQTQVEPEPELERQPEPSQATTDATAPPTEASDLSAYTTQFDEPDWITDDDLGGAASASVPDEERTDADVAAPTRTFERDAGPPPEAPHADHFAQGAALEPFDLDASVAPEASTSVPIEPSEDSAQSASAAQPEAAPRDVRPTWDPDEPEPDDSEPEAELPPRVDRSLPGAEALDDALAALGGPKAFDSAPDRQDEARSAPGPTSSPPPATAFNWRPPPDRQVGAQADWLGERPGPAARAYRRLRRIFPG
jgi:hypothetical protein